MQVRHNTSLLEQAVALAVRQKEIPTLQAQAAAFKARERATGFKRLATGGAIALAAIGLGWGLSLAYPRFFEDRDIPASPRPPSTVTETPSRVEPASEIVEKSSRQLPSAESSPATPTVSKEGPIGEVTTDFTKFQFQDFGEFGETWNIAAGHHFASNSDAQWDRAWCYTNHLVDGVSLQVDLVTRATPDAPPHALLATRETLAKANLSDDKAILLVVSA